MKTRTLKAIFIVLIILVMISVFIAGTMLTLPLLKRTEVDVAKEQADKMQRSYASSDVTSNADTNSLSREYEIKDEETWDVSENGDGSVIAKWTLENRTLTISGTGEIKNWESSDSSDWHNSKYKNIIKNVVIEGKITRIGSYAFYRCSRIESINIPSSVTSIGYEAFYGCSSLASINIPSSVTSIKYYAFYGCSRIERINIPSGVTSIGNYTFFGCESLTSINIPSSVTSIEYEAFYSCSSLESINIPNSVTRIGNHTFSGCTSLESINIPETVTKINDYAIPSNTIIYTKANSEGHRYAEEGKQGYIIWRFEPTEYIIKDKYIVKIKPNTTYTEFKKDISTNMTYSIKEGTKTISGTDIIKTGQVLTTEAGEEYTLVVIGDLNGDGKISLVELARISKIGAGKVNDIKEIEKMAIDVNTDGNITILDLASIAKLQSQK